MPKSAAHGRFVWHDLATPNPDAAKAFYPQITPWQTQAWDDDATDYTMWTLEGAPIGGVTPLASDVASTGMSPQWLAYVSVYDVDASVRQVASLGGQVRMGPKEVPHVGCWAVIADPQGATIGVFEPAATPPGHAGPPNIGEFSWHELSTTDYKSAAEFYRAIFKWEKISDYDMGEMGMYYMFGQRGETYGGMFDRRPDMPPPNWLSYVRVEGVKPVADKVKQLGGTVFNGPMEVPGGDWIAQCVDPQGAAFALHAK
jgi:predicted enzyme related to lactoylglutathione lyase